jgi:hypothetical protein
VQSSLVREDTSGRPGRDAAPVPAVHVDAR